MINLHLTSKMGKLLIIALLLIGCASNKKVIEVCGLQEPGEITVKMTANDLTNSRMYSLNGVAFEDETNEPFPFVKIKLTDKNDSKNIVGALTDIDGTFALHCKEGAYWLEISSVGYETYSDELMAFELTHESMEIRLKD